MHNQPSQATELLDRYTPVGHLGRGRARRRRNRLGLPRLPDGWRHVAAPSSPATTCWPGREPGHAAGRDAETPARRPTGRSHQHARRGSRAGARAFVSRRRRNDEPVEWHFFSFPVVFGFAVGGFFVAFLSAIFPIEPPVHDLSFPQLIRHGAHRQPLDPAPNLGPAASEGRRGRARAPRPDRPRRHTAQ